MSWASRLGLPRPHYALIAVYAFIAAGFGRAYFPSTPLPAHLMTAAFSLAGLLFAVTAMRERPLPRLLAARALLAALLAGYLLYMHALSGLVAFGVDADLGLALVGLELAGLWALARAPRSPGGQLAAATGVLATALAYVPLCIWMWYPPTLARCAAPERPGLVRRLTPAGFPEQLSYPYHLIYVPEHRAVIASFKTTGNLTFGFWERDEANQLVSIDLARREVHVLPLPGPTLPEYLLYEPNSERLVLARLGGFTPSSLDLLQVGDGAVLSPLRRLALDFAPHTLARLPSGGIADVAVRKQLVVYDRELAEQRRVDLRAPGFSGFICTAALQSGSRLYVALLAGPIAEIDLESFAVRHAEVPLGGGQLAVDTRRGLLFQADYVRQGVNVVDTATMSLRGRVELPYTPRAIHFDSDRELLLVADWFGGAVHFYRAGPRLELVELATPVDVGPYVRDFAYDPERARLYAATKCGVYELDLTGVDFNAADRARMRL